jgi:hypothetical protein
VALRPFGKAAAFARVAMLTLALAPRAAFGGESGDRRDESVVAPAEQRDEPEFGAAPLEQHNDVSEAPDLRSLWGPTAGVLTAMVPLAVGGAFLAHDLRPDLQRTGTYVILAGFAAAPWVSHGISGQWRRAVAFGLTSVAASTGALVAMSLEDPFDPYIANHDRLPFGLLLTTAFFAAAVGVADSFIMGPEPQPRR